MVLSTARGYRERVLERVHVAVRSQPLVPTRVVFTVHEAFSSLPHRFPHRLIYPPSLPSTSITMEKFGGRRVCVHIQHMYDFKIIKLVSQRYIGNYKSK